MNERDSRDIARRITMADIARRAGVHATTVSLALRNHPRLPEKTRNRIQKLAKEMGYAPDPWIRALVDYRGRIRPRLNRPAIAYVTNWATRWGWKSVTAHPDFYEGACERADELGFKIDHFWLREAGWTDERLSQVLYTRGIQGIIIASHAREMGDTIQLDWKNFSSVKIDYFPHHPAVHNVTNNQCDIIRLAMQKVMAAGYRRIGFVMHRGWDDSVDHLWIAGYLCEQQALSAGQRIPPHLFPEKFPAEQWTRDKRCEAVADLAALREWIEDHRPEVIISKRSFVLPVFRKLGLRVPEDIAFVDLFWENDGGATAGVRQNHKTVGALAVELLAGQLQHNRRGVPEIPTTTYVEGTWFPGRSLPERVRNGSQFSRALQCVAG